MSAHDNRLSSSRNAMSLYAKDRHKRAARMLGYALTLGTAKSWHDAAGVWAVRLTAKELGGIAYAALSALDPDDREAIFNYAHWGEM